jgi:hypothetical protein
MRTIAHLGLAFRAEPRQFARQDFPTIGFILVVSPSEFLYNAALGNLQNLA